MSSPGPPAATPGTIPSAPRRRASRTKRVAAAIFSLALGLAIGEVVVRLFFPQSDFFSRSDETTGVTGVPNLVGRMCDPEFSTHVTTNSFGFRDRERPLEKPPGGKRVVVLGDSFTEGLQVELEETYHDLLEVQLKSRIGPSCDVVAMGLPGVGTSQELLLFEHLGVRFSPDVVLVMWYSGNDLQDNDPRVKYYYPGFRLGPGPDELIPVPWRKQVGSEGLLGDIVRTNRCQLLSLVARAYRRWWLLHELKTRAPATQQQPPPSPPAPGVSPPPPAPPPQTSNGNDDEAWEITRRIMKRLRDVTAKNGATLVVAMIPHEPELDHHVTGEHVAEICRGLGVRSVDLAPVLRAARAAHPEAALYFPLDRHFTPRGQAAIVPPLVDAIEPLLRK